MDVDQHTIELLVTGAGFTGGGYWFKRWTTRVDKQLEVFAAELADLRLKVEVSKVKRAMTAGQVRQLTLQLQEMIKAQGRFEANLAKLWGFLEKKFNGEAKRLSDGGKDEAR